MGMNARIAILGLVLGLLLTGCRSKAAESFISAVTPNEEKPRYMGDKHSNGGMGGANSGTKLGYESGSRNVGTVSTYDDPAKGTGNQPGENPGAGGPNGPAMQNNVTNSISGRLKS
jgi:hypothetical protein